MENKYKIKPQNDASFYLKFKQLIFDLLAFKFWLKSGALNYNKWCYFHFESESV